MAKAFFDDPMTQYVMHNVDKRMAISNWMFTILVYYCRKWGEVYTDDTQTGGSLWLTPGNTTMSPLRILRMGMWQMPFRLGFKGFSRFNKIDGMAAKVHKRHVPGDHWYMLMLGVDPDQQGTGLGSAAIDAGAAKAQGAGLPVYLDTMTQSNVDYYVKRGFEIAEEFDVDSDLHVWSMIKHPS